MENLFWSERNDDRNTRTRCENLLTFSRHRDHSDSMNKRMNEKQDLRRHLEKLDRQFSGDNYTRKNETLAEKICEERGGLFKFQDAREYNPSKKSERPSLGSSRTGNLNDVTRHGPRKERRRRRGEFLTFADADEALFNKMSGRGACFGNVRNEIERNRFATRDNRRHGSEELQHADDRHSVRQRNNFPRSNRQAAEQRGFKSSASWNFTKLREDRRNNSRFTDAPARNNEVPSRGNYRRKPAHRPEGYGEQDLRHQIGFRKTLRTEDHYTKDKHETQNLRARENDSKRVDKKKPARVGNRKATHLSNKDEDNGVKDKSSPMEFVNEGDRCVSAKPTVKYDTNNNKNGTQTVSHDVRGDGNDAAPEVGIEKNTAGPCNEYFTSMAAPSKPSGNKFNLLEEAVYYKGHRVIGNQLMSTFQQGKTWDSISVSKLCEIVTGDHFEVGGDKIIVMVGTDDLLNDADLYKLCGEYEEMVHYLSQTCSKIVLVTVPPIPRLTHDRRLWNAMVQFNDFVKELGVRLNVNVVDFNKYLCVGYQRTCKDYFEEGEDAVYLNHSGRQLLRAAIDIEYFSLM